MIFISQLVAGFIYSTLDVFINKLCNILEYAHIGHKPMDTVNTAVGPPLCRYNMKSKILETYTDIMLLCLSMPKSIHH